MSVKQTTNVNNFKLPLERIFELKDSYKVLDYMLAHYELEQTIDDISKHVDLSSDSINNIVMILINEKIIKKASASAYLLNFRSDRVIGLNQYYRATMYENLKNMLDSKMTLR